jgi:hypothetical protein
MRPDENDFHGQFLLSSQPCVLSGWTSLGLGDWTLAAHPALPVSELRTLDEDQVGWLLGYAIDETGEWVESKHLLPFASSAHVTAEAFENWLYSLGGRFAGILLTNYLKRVYLDPGGTLAAVYSAEGPAVASTTSLLIAGRAQSSHEPLLRNQFFPAGLTAYPQIRRLLPNHYLDLHQMRPVRHWLTESLTWAGEEQIPSLVATIASHVRRTVHAVVRRNPTYMSLTAGRDSRMLLACSREITDRMSFITFDHNEQPGHYTDVQVALKIARQWRLRHEVVPIVPPADALKELYLQRIGHAGHWGKARDFYHACSEHLDLRHALLTGFAGEVGRSFYWRRVTHDTGTPSAAELLNVMRLPDSEPFLTALGQWLEGIRPDDLWVLLDQAYLELRVGCWAAVQMYGVAPFALTLTPFCHRNIFESMLRLPVEYRRSQGLAADLIRHAWPELGELPFNRDFEATEGEDGRNKLRR